MKIPRLACSDSFGFPCFKVSVCHRLCAFALAAILAFAQDLLAQSATRSIGWVVISVDEYRSLRARAFPSERGAPFAKKGGSELSLPKMDVPISVLNWEVFLPEQYKVKDFGGDAFAANLLPAIMIQSMGMAGKGDSFQAGVGFGAGVGSGSGAGIGGGRFRSDMEQALLPGQMGGFIVDPSGALVTNAQITVVHPQTGTTQHAMTDSSGHWTVSNIPSGPVKVTMSSPGFHTIAQNFNYDASRPMSFNSSLSVGAVSSSVEVTSSTAELQTESRRIERELKKDAAAAQTAASPNVLNLQRRVSGVLPVRIDVPRAGNSYRFVRPLVVDEETKVTFAYKSK